MGAFEKIAWYWRAYNIFALEFIHGDHCDRVMTLSAEDLFDGKRIEEIFRFVGTQAPDGKAVNNELGKKHNVQEEEEFPLFQEWPSKMVRSMD